jgi:hypothetical protein
MGYKGESSMPDTKAEQDRDSLDFSAGIQKADRLGTLLVSLPKWTACAVIAWQIRLSIEVLVGKYAFPSLLTRFWRQASVWEVVCWTAGMLGLLLGFYSRHLLNRQVTQALMRMDSLERRLDARSAPGSGRSGA